MTDIATLLKSEITRLSKKVLRQHLTPLRASQTAQRRQLAQLRAQVLSLQKEVTGLRRSNKSLQLKKPSADENSKPRFVAKGLKSLRKRLGFSAEDAGLMLEVSAQTIFNWEKGTKPRPSQLMGITALRGMGKREAQWRLAELKEDTRPKKGPK